MPQGECVTTPLIESLLGSGKRVYVPRVYGSGRHEMRMLRIESMAELDNFPRSKWGIPEPSDEQAANMEDGVESGGIDLVVVPAVAFDSRCQRLGHGRGYYGARARTSPHTRARPLRTPGHAIPPQHVPRHIP